MRPVLSREDWAPPHPWAATCCAYFTKARSCCVAHTGNPPTRRSYNEEPGGGTVSPEPLELGLRLNQPTPPRHRSCCGVPVSCVCRTYVLVCCPNTALNMKISVVPGAAIALGLFCDVDSFAPLPAGWQLRQTSSAWHMIPSGRPRSATSSRVMMMGGFGGPVKKKKVVGVGRGQDAYQRQVKSYHGLIAAGAEGADVYVHREVLRRIRFD